MPEHPRPPQPRRRAGSGRTTPKGTRPPGVDDRRPPAPSVGVDHHLDTSRRADPHGRSTPPVVPRQRSGHRGGR